MFGNRKTLTDRVAQRLGMGIPEASDIVETVMESRTEELITRGGIQVTGFGSLRVVTSPAKTVRNPQNGQKADVPAKNRVKFSPGTLLLRYVNGGQIPSGGPLLAKRSRSVGAVPSVPARGD